MVSKDNIELLVIDGFENIYIKNTKTEEAVSEVFPYLKKIAQDIDIPVLITVGLNRNLESRKDKSPRLTDFNNYRVIERNANSIIYLYRDDIYKENSQFKGLAHLIFENSDGRNNRTILLVFDGKNSCFKHYNY